MRIVGALISVYPSISDLKRLYNVKPSDTGSLTQLFLVEETVKDALLLLKKTCYYYAVKMPDCSTLSMEKAVVTAL